MTYFGKRLGVAAVAVVTTGAIATACGSQGSSSPTATSASPTTHSAELANWPPQADQFRFHWSASPGIDLTAGSTVPLRAYVESYLLAQIANDESAVYPGFMRATPENVGSPGNPDPAYQLVDVRPSPQVSGSRNRGNRLTAGFQPTHILSLEPRGEGYRATVCLGLYSVYQTIGDTHDKYVSVLADPTTGEPMYTGEGKAREGGIDVWVVELTDKDPRAGDQSSVAFDPQIGPLPAPISDAFGKWFITGRSSGLWGTREATEDIATPEVRKQCAAAMPDDSASRIAMATGFHDSPPPHGKPIPGWPDKVQ